MLQTKQALSREAQLQFGFNNGIKKIIDLLKECFSDDSNLISCLEMINNAIDANHMLPIECFIKYVYNDNRDKLINPKSKFYYKLKFTDFIPPEFISKISEYYDINKLNKLWYNPKIDNYYRDTIIKLVIGMTRMTDEYLSL